MIDRITLILKAKNITPAQLADDLRVQRSGISHILNGRNKPSLDFIQKILKRYPDISMPWLLFGDGPMINQYQSLNSKKGVGNDNLSNEQPSIIDLFVAEDTLSDDKTNEKAPEMFGSDMESSGKQKLIPSLQIETDLEQKNIMSDFESSAEKVASKNESDRGYLRKEQVPTNSNHKTIRRIIIFYEDKSFVEYIPGID